MPMPLAGRIATPSHQGAVLPARVANIAMKGVEGGADEEEDTGDEEVAARYDWQRPKREKVKRDYSLVANPDGDKTKWSGYMYYCYEKMMLQKLPMGSDPDLSEEWDALDKKTKFLFEYAALD